MYINLSLDVWMDFLQVLVPAEGVVHVGAGSGHAAVRYADWGIDTAIFIEADENFQDKLTATLHGHSGWNMHTALVSDTEEEMDFFVASNPNESGVLRPELFAGFWQNLGTREQRRLNATTLDSILAVSKGSTKINWAVADCVPALPILRGAKQYLDRWDVVIARVILDESKAPKSEMATKSRVDEFLCPRGYSCVAYQEELQPAVGRAFYVRNWNHLYKKKLERERHLASARQMDEEQFSIALDTQTALAVERQARLDQLAKAHGERAVIFATVKDELTAQIEDFQRQVAQLTQEGTDSQRLLTERENQLGELTRAHDDLAHVSQERSAQIDQLEKAHEERAADFSTVKEDLTAQIEDLQRQVAQLMQKGTDSQRLLNERESQLGEITRAYDELAHVSQERSAQIDHLEKAHEERAADFSTVKEELMAQIEDFQRHVAQLTQEGTDSRRLLKERENQLGELTRAHGAQTRLATERLTQIERRLAAEATLQQELLEARQSASLGIKLQTLREADLKDLQLRYKESLSVRDRQHQMLAKLGERLSVASGYFHQLAEKRAVLEHDVEQSAKVNPYPQPKLSPMLERKSGSQTNSKQQSKRLLNVNRKSPRAKSTSKPSSKRKRRV
jgi:DNA repair exonuclease SbcCD ATPase subunit